MCGIVGYVGSTFSQEELNKNIRVACKTLNHRGPDQEGIYVEDGIALGISRLAIRDSENGKQPMTRQGWTLVFNGELYDTHFLKDHLLKVGYVFETASDTEILLNAFLEFGPALFSKLNGMFAFALWEAKSKTLYLCRDRWGEKPLYYTYTEDFLIFASEIKAFRHWPFLKWEINLNHIQVFLKNSYLPHPCTGWKDIFKLEQGSFLMWQDGILTKKMYYSPSLLKEKNNSLNGSQELFNLLNESVKHCAVSDRPVGVFLSGGLDSTTIAYFLSQHQEEVPAFSLHWEDENYTEELYTTHVARLLGLTHHTVKCDPSYLMQNFDFIANQYDEPFADESMVPTFCLASFTKQKVDVVLTGDGADEFFHGYERYFFKGPFEKYLEVFAATSNDNLTLICQPDFIKSQTGSLFLSHYKHAKTNLDENRLRSWVDINTYLIDNILMKVDRACMGVSLESRAPFLTPAVTNFALNCSMQELTHNSFQGKEILRLAMKNHLPSLILKRKKMGFGVPLNQWFQTSLKEWMTMRLLEGELLKTGWFSLVGIEKLITNPGHCARTIFNLLVLEVWLKKNKIFSF